MRWAWIYSDTLIEHVFQYRNKEYGCYQLRKRYVRNLLVSSVVGTILILLIALVPFFIFMIREMNPNLDVEYIYEVEYIPFAPPEEIELVELAIAHSELPEEKKEMPVIVEKPDPEEEKPILDEEPPPEEVPQDADTASYGTGGEEVGRQPGTDTTLATTIDVYPLYPGGVEGRLYYLRRNVVYPKEAVEKGIQGVVMVVFVIETDGSVTNIQVSRGIGGGCDEEAVRVTRNMPKWTPGKRSGHPVRVMVKMPIVFKLPNRSS